MLQFGHVVTLVQERADLDTVLVADRTTRAVLVVLGERLAAGGHGRVAAHLPAPLASELPAVGDGSVFGVDGFYERVADLAGVEPPVARSRARTVVAVLRELLPADTFDEISRELPSEYDDLVAP